MENSTYEYAHAFEFERTFDQWSAKHWTEQHWVAVCGTAGLAYLGLVYSGRQWMADREPFHLRGALAAWSGLLAAFSLAGFLRTAPELLHTLGTGGLRASVCSASFLETNKVSALWTWLFILSKLPELGDTAFIVLRKQKLIFLHWYHHLTVLVYCFYCFSQFPSTCRWFMVMNYCVHSTMYSYYTLRALRVRVPRGVAMVITSLQLVQMVVGCTINCLAWHYKQTDPGCAVTETNLTYSLLMYFSYFVLFARFFHTAYFQQGRAEGKKEK